MKSWNSPEQQYMKGIHFLPRSVLLHIGISKWQQLETSVATLANEPLDFFQRVWYGMVIRLAEVDGL